MAGYPYANQDTPRSLARMILDSIGDHIGHQFPTETVMRDIYEALDKWRDDAVATEVAKALAETNETRELVEALRVIKHAVEKA